MLGKIGIRWEAEEAGFEEREGGETGGTRKPINEPRPLDCPPPEAKCWQDQGFTTCWRPKSLPEAPASVFGMLIFTVSVTASFGTPGLTVMVAAPTVPLVAGMTALPGQVARVVPHWKVWVVSGLTESSRR